MWSRIAIGGLILATVGVCIAFFSPQPLYAHGSGLTLTATTSTHFVDIDYSTFSIVEGETGYFVFRLFADAERTESVEFTTVWVRISLSDTTYSPPRDRTIFSGWVARPQFGSTGLSIALPTRGEYVLSVRYNNGDNQLVDTAIPFTVNPPYEESAYNYHFECLIGLCLGGLIPLLIAAVYRYRRQFRSVLHL